MTGNPYMFTGRRFDLETGLYFYRARYYNPYIGRFLQVDPVGQGMNLYAYCGNNPVNYIDPSGLVEQVVTGRYWVLPDGYTPGTVHKYSWIPGWSSIFELGIIDITVEDLTNAKVDEQLVAYEAALRTIPAILAAILRLPAAPPIVNFLGWVTFIEVQDWIDENDSNTVDEDELGYDIDGNGELSDEEKGKRYWIEIIGIGNLANDKNTWVPESETWLTVTDAADAGGQAIWWAYCYGTYGVLPNSALVKGKTHEAWQMDPYIRDVPYVYNPIY
ncbi:RHS repeat-associated core domain-containing protein [Planctomycetota bacterium]